MIVACLQIVTSRGKTGFNIVYGNINSHMEGAVSTLGRVNISHRILKKRDFS